VSVFGIQMASALAAKRCGADPTVWNAVHSLHSARIIAVVSSPGHVSVTGPITQITDDGFTVAGAYTFKWPEVSSVAGTSREQP